MRHAGPTRTVALLAAAVLAAAILAAAGCSRLNPDWCAERASCGPNQYCDPHTNTCRQQEAGAPDSSGLDAGADTLPPDRGPDGPTDAGPDDQQDLPAPDLAAPDLPTPDAGGG
jgi:hypothetical protein